MRPLFVYTMLTQRRRRALSARAQAQARIGRAGLGCGALLAMLLVAMVLLGAAGYARLTTGLPSVDLLPALLDPEEGLLNQPTRVYDRSGQYLIYTLENPGVPRRWLPLDEDQPVHLSPLLAEVMVAVRDPGFWNHPGFSWRGLLDPGPQTLAERLVDRLLLEDEPAGLSRTVRMRLLAAQITARFGREQVLEWYLNSAALGHMTFGVDSAARLYLNRSAADLNLAEAALLAALDEAPALNPLDAPQGALERQRVALDRLLVSGAISEQDYLTARDTPLGFHPELAAPPQTGRAFARLALEGLARQIGRERLERGGLTVLTSLDYDLQQQVDCTARLQLLRLSGQAAQNGGQECAAAGLLPTLPPGTDAPPGTLASAAVLDLATGEVLAYVGETLPGGETASTGGHAPGSLLSPFVALAGFARGMGPASLVWDVPAVQPSGVDYADYRGPLRLRTALANDLIPPFASLLAQIGPANVWRVVEPLGLGELAGAAHPDELLSGGGQVGLLDVAQAYAAFARLGTQVGQPAQTGGALEPILVRSVRSQDGRVLWGPVAAESRPVLAAPLAYLVHHILADSTARRESLGYPNPLELGRPAGARMGVADDGRQVWTVGYTPQRLTVTWFGLPDDVDGSLDTTAAAGLWYAIQQQAVAELPQVDWSEPAGISRVDVCDPSGLLPTAACPAVVSELFLSGEEPTAYDSLYRSVAVNRETGRLATVFTPPELVEQRVYLYPPPEARAWAAAANLSQPPETYDAIQAPLADSDVRFTAPEAFAAVRGEVSLRGAAAGEDFVSYRLQVGQGLNPQSWQQVGAQVNHPVEDGELGRWDTRGLEGLYAVRLQVVRSGQRVDTAVIQVTVDNEAPLLDLLYPSEGAEVTRNEAGFVTLQARVSDQLQVAQVEWLVDGLVVGEQSSAPFSYPWQAAPGVHRLAVRASDLAGNQVESAPVEFRVK